MNCFIYSENILFYTISICDALLTIFDLGQVPHHHVSHRNLDDISFPHDSELLLLLNPTLQTPELLLFGPVIKCRNQDDTHNRQQDGCALNPACVRLAFILCTPRPIAASWREWNRGVGRCFVKNTARDIIQVCTVCYLSADFD